MSNHLGSLCRRGHEHKNTGQSLRSKSGHCVECEKLRHKSNAEYRNEYMKKYNKRPEVRARIREYERDYRNNPARRIHRVMSESIRSILGPKKRYKKWEDLTGYKKTDLLAHLEKQFTDRMNWNNYGSYWEIDHIIPKSLFNIENEESNEFKECWSLSNLQPLEKSLNRAKGNRFIG